MKRAVGGSRKSGRIFMFFIRGVLGVIRWPESACKDSPLYKSILEPKLIAFAIKTKEGMTRHDLRIRGVRPTSEVGEYAKGRYMEQGRSNSNPCEINAE